MKINKFINKAFPAFTKPYNKLIINNFIHLVETCLPLDEKSKKEIKAIVAKDFTSDKNGFFESKPFIEKDGSWFGCLIEPRKHRLNDRMWWFASGWIRSRNQILNSDSNVSNHPEDAQVCFVGLIKMHEQTLKSMQKYFKSIDVNLTDTELENFHTHLVNHYLKNQNFIIGDSFEKT